MSTPKTKAPAAPPTPTPADAEASLHVARLHLLELEGRFGAGEIVPLDQWRDGQAAVKHAERVLEAATVAHAREGAASPEGFVDDLNACSDASSVVRIHRR